MSLLREIQNDLVSAGGDIASLLRKCKILAARLRSDEFARWVDFELDGYPESQPTPEYRCLGATLYANFLSIHWRADRQVVPWVFIPEKDRDALAHKPFRAGVAKAASFTPNGARIDLPALVFRLQGKMYPEMNCVGAWLEISGSEFEQLISAVKTRILDFVLKIEAENPAAGEAPPNTQPVPSEKLRPLVHNIFYGPVATVAQSSEHFTQTVNIGVQPQELTRLVMELNDHLQELNLTEREKRRAEAQIVTLKAELNGEPDPQTVRQAGRTLRNILESAIGSLLATAAQPTVWHWVHQTLVAISR
jgi:hypothetical protein